ncbi:MAG: hypothetical protein AB1597_02845 [Chloroflexota bacterium]
MKNKSQIAGILAVIAGTGSVMPIVTVILSIYFFRDLMSTAVSTTPGTPFPDEVVVVITLMYVAGAVLAVVLGILSVVGGVNALRKKHWGLAFVGSISGALVFLPVGVAAAVFTAKAKDEFRRADTAPPVAGLPQPSPALESTVSRNNSRLAGILTIISGAFAFLWAAQLTFGDPVLQSLGSSFPRSPATPGIADISPSFASMASLIGDVQGVIFALLGALAVIGGILAFTKAKWPVVLAGSIASTLVFFPCGIPAVIFAVSARDEFLTTDLKS